MSEHSEIERQQPRAQTQLVDILDLWNCCRLSRTGGDGDSQGNVGYVRTVVIVSTTRFVRHRGDDLANRGFQCPRRGVGGLS